jgi:hypothetical protein
MKLLFNGCWVSPRNGKLKPLPRIGILILLCALTGLELAGAGTACGYAEYS